MSKLVREGSLSMGERMWLKYHLGPAELEAFLWEATIRRTLGK